MTPTKALQSLIDKKLEIEQQIRDKSGEIENALTEKLKHKVFYYGAGNQDVDEPNVMVDHVKVEFTISSFVFVVYVRRKLKSGEWSARLHTAYYSELKQVPIKKIDLKL